MFYNAHYNMWGTMLIMWYFMRLVYSGGAKWLQRCWLDSSILDNMSSSSEFVFSFRSDVVTWSSKKKPTIALSSTEANYKDVLMIIICEVAWLCKLFVDLSLHVDNKALIYVKTFIAYNWPRTQCSMRGRNKLCSLPIH